MMNTQDKIEQIEEFLSRPENRLIHTNSNSNSFNLSTYFDVEVSSLLKAMDFSIQIEMENLNEAIVVMNAITINKNKDYIEKELLRHLNKSSIDTESRFFLIVKGNYQSK